MKKIILTSLAAALATTLGTQEVCAAEPPAETVGRVDARPAITVQARLDGVILSVNRRERTVTLQVKGEVHTVKVPLKTKLTRAGKPLAFEELVPGQQISLTLIQLENGEVELDALAVLPSAVKVQPASGGKTVVLPPPAPFPNPPNPANGGGPVVSPHK